MLNKLRYRPGARQSQPRRVLRSMHYGNDRHHFQCHSDFFFFSVTQIFSHFRFDRIVYATNAQYLYLIRRLSALRFSGRKAITWVILMTGPVVRTGERS